MLPWIMVSCNVAINRRAMPVSQDPYNIGYQGVIAAVKAVNGEQVDKRIDTGTYIISQDNVKDEQQKLQEILGR